MAQILHYKVMVERYFRGSTPRPPSCLATSPHWGAFAPYPERQLAPEEALAVIAHVRVASNRKGRTLVNNPMAWLPKGQLRFISIRTHLVG